MCVCVCMCVKRLTQLLFSLGMSVGKITKKRRPHLNAVYIQAVEERSDLDD